MKQLIEKVSIVTGGGKNLGKNIAFELASNGYSVVINYWHSEKEAFSTAAKISALGGIALPVKADISQEKDVRKLVEKTIKVFKKIDLLVNNASVFFESPLCKTTKKIWDTTIDINLKGTFLCSQAVAPFMIKQKGGRIINISSVGGILGWPNYLPYSVSKSGIIMLTKILAKSLAPFVMVNSIAPGFIQNTGKLKQGSKKMPLKKIPLNKYGDQGDITEMVIYLATKAKYITGQTLIIDGGRSIA